MKKYYQIAIDGPAGSGKSTIAKLVARNMNFLYVDSGAMYRAVALYMIKNKLLNESESGLKKYLKKIKIDFKLNGKNQLVFLNGKNVTKSIRLQMINKVVSEISAKKVIREEMVKRQKKFAFSSSVVMDGRDIGTAVFPGADLKIYLTASSLVRAKRRQKDFDRLGEKLSLKELEKQIHERDNYDSGRVISPLCKPQDAIVIDSSDLTINQVLEQISFLLPVVP